LRSFAAAAQDDKLEVHARTNVGAINEIGGRTRRGRPKKKKEGFLTAFGMTGFGFGNEQM
jgi:hypothetical protein